MAAKKGKVRVDDKILRLTELGVLLAIIIIMAFVPMIGYIKLGVVEITLITVPVIIGAMVLGPASGALLGFAFGLTSFLQCVFGLSAFGVALLEINPIFAFLVTVPTRTLMGWLTGLFFKAIKQENIVGYSLTGLVGSLLNTLFFMTTLIALYWNTEFMQGLVSSLGATGVFSFVVALVGINGLVEAICCTILSAVICKALNVWFKS
ncbi:MAG: ECF transporter S component [Clostridiales bacterium]|nr:ECF transporter S component [Clostridiales bacterium]